MGTKLTQFHTNDTTLGMLQNQWAAVLDPVITALPNNPVILPKIQLKPGQTIISHRLGRILSGWKVVRQRAAASIYDVQDSNPTPDLTLLLHSDTTVVVDLEVF